VNNNAPRKNTAVQTADAMSVIFEGTEEVTSKNDTGASAADWLHIEEKESYSLDELLKLKRWLRGRR
jgi:hypothetical protein